MDSDFSNRKPIRGGMDDDTVIPAWNGRYESDVKVTGQDLKDYLGGGGGLPEFVTVGTGGDYPTVNDAWDAGNRFLRLLKGNHELTRQLDYYPLTDGPFKIVGSGMDDTILDTNGYRISYSASQSEEHGFTDSEPVTALAYTLEANRGNTSFKLTLTGGAVASPFHPWFGVGSWIYVEGGHYYSRFYRVLSFTQDSPPNDNIWYITVDQPFRGITGVQAGAWFDNFMMPGNIELRDLHITGGSRFINNRPDILHRGTTYENIRIDMEMSYDAMGNDMRVSNCFIHEDCYAGPGSMFENCVFTGSSYAYNDNVYERCVFNFSVYFRGDFVRYLHCHFPTQDLATEIAAYYGGEVQYHDFVYCLDYTGMMYHHVRMPN